MDKKTLCLYFQVHQPIRLRKYHFFDIGKNSDYYDDFANRTITRKVADPLLFTGQPDDAGADSEIRKEF